MRRFNPGKRVRNLCQDSSRFPSPGPKIQIHYSERKRVSVLPLTSGGTLASQSLDPAGRSRRACTGRPEARLAQRESPRSGDRRPPRPEPGSQQGRTTEGRPRPRPALRLDSAGPDRDQAPVEVAERGERPREVSVVCGQPGTLIVQRAADTTRGDGPAHWLGRRQPTGRAATRAALQTPARRNARTGGRCRPPGLAAHAAR